ncbi:MAG TPA: ribonucleoside hydrolase [Firmicutes bacterium]|jgi:ribosylpyrimidine nucleosidase|nr:ribonucleoside hydrolase [Bacillota bacterium]
MDRITNKLPIILDSDPGCDDAVAIMLAAKHPLFNLQVITVTAGNHILEKTTQNALKVCSYLGIDNVPVAAGMSGPIIRRQVIADHIHGENGLGNIDFDEIRIRLDHRHAVTLIIEILLESNGDITFVATGPLSNLAMAMRLEPKIIPKIKQIVLIGGSYQLGNITPAAEFNMYADPEAAHIIFTCGRPIVMIGLSITEKVLFKKEVAARIGSIDNKAATLFTKVMDFYTKSNKRIFGHEVSPLYDPAAIVYLINPSIFTTKLMHVEIELKSEQSYGRTNCDFYGLLNKPANAEVVTDLDSERFWEIIDKTIRLYGRT